MKKTILTTMLLATVSSAAFADISHISKNYGNACKSGSDYLSIDQNERWYPRDSGFRPDRRHYTVREITLESNDRTPHDIGECMDSAQKTAHLLTNDIQGRVYEEGDGAFYALKSKGARDTAKKNWEYVITAIQNGFSFEQWRLDYVEGHSVEDAINYLGWVAKTYGGVGDD